MNVRLKAEQNDPLWTSASFIPLWEIACVNQPLTTITGKNVKKKKKAKK
jgi:hypothetical protein